MQAVAVISVYAIVLVVWLVIGAIGGFLLTKLLVRREIAKRALTISLHATFLNPCTMYASNSATTLHRTKASSMDIIMLGVDRSSRLKNSPLISHAKSTGYALYK